MHTFLPYYYSIKGYCKDGFSYVLYINGGHPPWTLLGTFYTIIIYIALTLFYNFQMLSLHCKIAVLFSFKFLFNAAGLVLRVGYTYYSKIPKGFGKNWFAFCSSRYAFSC